MQRVLFAGLTKFLQLKPRLDFLFIFGGKVINLFTHHTLKLDKIVLGHNLAI